MKMGRKIIAALLAVMMLLLCVACDEKKSTEDEEKGDKTSNASIFTIRYQGAEIVLGKNAATVLKKLGEAESSGKIASCGENMGDQWQYVYPSIVLYTVKNGDSEVIDAVTLRDDVAETGKGITIGSTEGAMKEAYGDPEATELLRRYRKDSYCLEFRLNTDGQVVGVEMRTES